MDVLVRYSELHKKKGKTRQQLVQALRQRINDKLEFEDIEFEKVSERPGRILIFNTTRQAALKISEISGVKSALVAEKTDSNIDSIKQELPSNLGESFGVRVNTRDIDFSSQELEKEFGAYIDERTDSEVDLENPETWVKIEITPEYTHVSTEEFEGPGGLPAATQGHYLTLISGGIDSPVAAHQIMKRGADITPIYFYNRPYSAEDHLMRFEKCVERLREFNPSKKWNYYIVDMKEANQKLQKIGKGRMVLHRRIMFEVADRLREEKSLDGIVTGESISQKSSQTPMNMKTTSVNISIFRPLLAYNKDEISEKARNIGTFEFSKIDSACRDISPESPSTNLSTEELEDLKEKVGFEELVEGLVEGIEVREL